MVERHGPAASSQQEREDRDAELLSAERRALVSNGLAALPERYRAVVVLRDIEELSNEETAAILGEPVGAVKSCLHRARMALREQLTRAYCAEVAPSSSRSRA